MQSCHLQWQINFVCPYFFVFCFFLTSVVTCRLCVIFVISTCYRSWLLGCANGSCLGDSRESLFWGMKMFFHCSYFWVMFLAATKQLYEWFSPSVCPSVRLSVCLSHLFDYVPIIISSWNFQKLLPVTKVTSMQKVKVRGQRSRSQRSQPNLTVSGL